MIYLLFATFFWGSTFLVQRSASLNIDPFLFNGIRFGVAGLSLLSFTYFKRISFCKQTLKEAIICGFIVAVAINLQQIGITYTSAGKAGIITSFYLIFIPLILYFNGRKISLAEIAALVTSLAGFTLLAGNIELKVEGGDVIVLISSFVFALHVISIGFYSRQRNPFIFSAYQFLTCGVLSLTASVFTATSVLTPIKNVWFELVYACFISVLLGYTFQVLGQRRTSTSVASFIMSLEGPIAMILGAIILNEQHTKLQNIGAFLIVFATLFISLNQQAQKRQNLQQLT